MAEIVPLEDRIAGLFSRALHVDVPSADTDLFETGVLDSLAFVELLLQLEREFGVAVSADDLDVENFKSIDRISGFVRSQMADRADDARVIHLVRRR